jgi:hypothetical protein
MINRRRFITVFIAAAAANTAFAAESPEVTVYLNPT